MTELESLWGKSIFQLYSDSDVVGGDLIEFNELHPILACFWSRKTTCRNRMFHLWNEVRDQGQFTSILVSEKCFLRVCQPLHTMLCKYNTSTSSFTCLILVFMIVLNVPIYSDSLLFQRTKYKSLQNFFNLLITSPGGLKHNAFIKGRGFSGCTDVPPSNRSRCGLFRIRISADWGKKGNVSCGLYL